MNLKQETLQKIEEVIPRYPEKRSAVLPILHLVQEDQGYISPEATEWIAGKLELKPINVWELVTFYPMLRDKPVGKKVVRVCRTLSCALQGSYRTCETLREALNCQPDDHSPDGEFTVEFAECLASCHAAPVVMVNDDLYERVDDNRARQLAGEIRNGKAGPAETA